LLECVPAWDGNWTWDCFLAFAWQGAGDERLLVTVNYAPNQSQCHARLPFADLGNSQWRLQDLLGDATYDWDGNDLQGRGLFLDERPWSARGFCADESVTGMRGEGRASAGSCSFLPPRHPTLVPRYYTGANGENRERFFNLCFLCCLL
jgi:hypothetical protein